jgi:hypothetical protein
MNKLLEQKRMLILLLIFVSVSIFCQANEDTRVLFKDFHASDAQIIDVMDAAFLSKTKKLTYGAYYIIQPCINGHVQNSDFITIYSPDFENYINAKSDTLYRWLKPNMSIIVLLKYTGNTWRPFDVIEILSLSGK